jgi:hypothetical protein
VRLYADRDAGRVDTPMEATSPRTSRVPAILLAGLLGWHGLALIRAAHTAAAPWQGPEPNFRLAARWQPGTRQVDNLERFLAMVREATPPGSRIAFLSDQSFTPDGFYSDLWAGYLLPEREVVPGADSRAWALASHVATYRMRLDTPELDLIRATPDGAIYRKLKLSR